MLERGVVALVCGVVLGFPHRARPGGMSTHVMVSFGAVAFAMIGRTADDEDVLRVVAGVCQGVGFIGAATVIRHRRYTVGITAAASIWIAGALGCASALGQQPLRAVALAAVAAVLGAALRRFERDVLGRSRRIAEIEAPSQGS